MFETYGRVYTMKEVDDFVNDCCYGHKVTFVYKKRGSYNVIEVPASFDIETTSTYVNGDKVAFMYIWQFGIDGRAIYGRTWEEFMAMLKKVRSAMKISYDNRLYIYVHFLSFEFQFIRKMFTWDSVFAISARQPIYARTVDGLEFRCSKMLTGTGLEKVGENLTKYKVEKLVGDLDYSKIRHSETPLTKEELDYCVNDVRVVMAHIKECMENEGSITKIPNTLTGYVRRDVRKAVLKDKKTTKMIQNLTLTSEEMRLFISAFQGGFTHANALHSGVTQHDVVSYDFTSSYPTVMIAEKFPMSNGIKVDVENLTYEQFTDYIRTHCCIMEIEFVNLKLKKDRGDCPISESKTTHTGNIVVDNGRVREADRLVTIITEQDYITYKKFYDIEEMFIHTMYVYQKAYLPKPFIEKLLEYYKVKTELKDVEGKEGEYLLSKGMFNAIFGMMVMSIVRDNYTYDGEWTTEVPNFDDAVEKYNSDPKRFNWYPWGVYITAYARKNLFTGIYECDNDYVYSDTDSVKILNADRHEDYILEYNRTITEKLETTVDFYNLNKNDLAPMTIKGKTKPLGVWDFDGHYKRFKTLGAKRYMVETDEGEIKTTIAGVGKKAGAKFFSKFDNPFDKFEDNAEIPSNETGKNVHTYSPDDACYDFECTDYLGNVAHVHVESWVHLESTSFRIGLSDTYKGLLEYLQMGYDDNVVYEQ